MAREESGTGLEGSGSSRWAQPGRKPRLRMPCAAHMGPCTQPVQCRSTNSWAGQAVQSGSLSGTLLTQRAPRPRASPAGGRRAAASGAASARCSHAGCAQGEARGREGEQGGGGQGTEETPVHRARTGAAARQPGSRAVPQTPTSSPLPPPAHLSSSFSPPCLNSRRKSSISWLWRKADGRFHFDARPGEAAHSSRPSAAVQQHRQDTQVHCRCAHLPSAFAFCENILAERVRLRKDTPLPMWDCGGRAGGWVAAASSGVQRKQALAPAACAAAGVWPLASGRDGGYRRGLGWRLEAQGQGRQGGPHPPAG